MVNNNTLRAIRDVYLDVSQLVRDHPEQPPKIEWLEERSAEIMEIVEEL